MNELQELIMDSGPPFRRDQIPYPTYKGVAGMYASIGMAKFGKQYPFTVPGEPVPKATTRPPRGKRVYQRVMTDENYKALAKTWLYQESVAKAAVQAEIPSFDKDDPIWMECMIYLGNRRLADRKNFIAAIEDGVAYGGFIPNDRQITGGIEMMAYNCQRPRVDVILRLDNRILNTDWLINTVGSRGKAKAYYTKLGMEVRICSACKNPFPVMKPWHETCGCMIRRVGNPLPFA